MSEYQTVLVERRGRVAILTMNRPEALNAYNLQLTGELQQALREVDADAGVGCIVLTGAGKAFAAGADIKEMASKDFAQVYSEDFITATWEQLTRTRKPVIAAVNGFALGGGCEWAMMCDMIFAADGAKFGQPEIKLGVIPGSGGTQRLTRLVGRAVAMDLILTGRTIDAAEALRIGLVSRVYPAAELMEETLKAAELIASYGPLSTMAAKEAVNRAEEVGLAEGVRFERRIFHALFGTAEQREGMAAFVEKRAAKFHG
ncbi:MAG: enoyl-CoA hydratase-related protein [Sphingomonadaceae bacterium]|nr:enoyl-CoA hydratase-related protein [Sphingomonadaceae bacterium]